MTTTWNEINPSKLSYPNLLANRVRWILENEKFSSVELESIRKSVRPYAPDPTHNATITGEANPEQQVQATLEYRTTEKVPTRGREYQDPKDH